MDINGYKTYAIGAATIIFGLAGMAIGQLDISAGMNFVFIGMTALGIRHGLAKASEEET